jgi:ferredoxin
MRRGRDCWAEEISLAEGKTGVTFCPSLSVVKQEAVGTCPPGGEMLEAVGTCPQMWIGEYRILSAQTSWRRRH